MMSVGQKDYGMNDAGGAKMLGCCAIVKLIKILSVLFLGELHNLNPHKEDCYI